MVKCELCDADAADEKCVFAIYKRVIDGETHFFCCQFHADEFEKKRGKSGTRKR